MSLLDLKANTTVERFQVSAYFTAMTPTTGSLSQHSNDWTPLIADYEDLPVNLKKRLIQQCQIGRTCRVTVKGRRGFGNTVVIDDLRFGG
jgi:hypothetical protein